MVIYLLHSGTSNDHAKDNYEGNEPVKTKGDEQGLGVSRRYTQLRLAPISMLNFPFRTLFDCCHNNCRLMN